MRAFLLTIVLFCFALPNYALPPVGNPLYDNFIIWSKDRKLEWSDFKGTPDASADDVAMTASSVEFYYHTIGKTVSWEITPKFFPDVSWHLENIYSEDVLKHEQLHFDITELYARLLRKQLKENVLSTADLPKLRKISDAVFEQWGKAQSTYDRETNHSMDKKAQQQWEENIAKQLEQLNRYATP